MKMTTQIHLVPRLRMGGARTVKEVLRINTSKLKIISHMKHKRHGQTENNMDRRKDVNCTPSNPNLESYIT